MRAIEAGRDFVDLERYLPAFIEEAASHAETALQARRRELRRQTAIDPDRIDSAIRNPQSAIPRAFELWILHLGELDLLSQAAALTLDDLTAEEARGLAMLRRARDKFWDEHRSCPQCRAVMSRAAGFCGCGWTEKN